MFRHIVLALAGSAALIAAPAAHADRVYWSVGIGVPGVVTNFSNAYPVYQAPPVVYAPPPVPPVYFAPPPPPPPPRPVYYGYGQVYTPVAVAPPYYYGPPGRRWDRDHWRHDHGWGHRDRRDWDDR
ncbi:MAG: glutelin [Thiomonas sp.]